MSVNSLLIYEKSDVLWVNPYIINQQQQQKQKQQQNQQIHFVNRNGKMCGKWTTCHTTME